MSLLLFALGVVALLVTAVDLIETTLTLRRGGPLTRRINMGLWLLLQRTYLRRTGFHRALSICGWLGLLLTVELARPSGVSKPGKPAA